jgi:hypothetical protein
MYNGECIESCPSLPNIFADMNDRVCRVSNLLLSSSF